MSEYSLKAMCYVLDVTRQGYYKYKQNKAKPYKHTALLAAIKGILLQDEFNDTYGRERLKIALENEGYMASERTIYRVLQDNGLKTPKKKPLSLTKSDKDAYKNDDILQGDFFSQDAGVKIISDITQLPTKDGKLYISAVFDCYNAKCIGLSQSSTMETELVVKSLKQASNHMKQGAIFHTDRGSQYTSNTFRTQICRLKLRQSMSHAKTNCYGNARCESMFARFKEEAIYNRYDTKNMSMEDVKSLVFRYFMSYWNNRRIFGKAKKKKAVYKIKSYINAA